MFILHISVLIRVYLKFNIVSEDDLVFVFNFLWWINSGDQFFGMGVAGCQASIITPFTIILMLNTAQKETQKSVWMINN